MKKRQSSCSIVPIRIHWLAGSQPVILIIATGILFSLLTGCASNQSSVPVNLRWAYTNGSQVQQAQAGEQFFFNILVDEGFISDGAPIKIKASGEVESGSLRFELRRPDGQAVWDSEAIRPGDFSISAEYLVPAEQIGTFSLGMVHTDNTTATYSLSWYAFKLGPAILLPGIGMILTGLVFVIYATRRRLLGWRYLFLGGLFWVLTVIIKFAVAIPLNPLVFRWLGALPDRLFSPGNLAAYLYIGALTGVFEAGLAWLILGKIRWGKASWNQALVFGIGFGVIEAVLLGGYGLAVASSALLAPNLLPVSTLGSLAANTTLAGLAPAIERFSVILVHIFACVLIFYAIASRQARWGWLAILYKTLLDTPAGFAAFWGTGTALKLWTIEAVVAVIGLIGLWGTFQIARCYPADIAGNNLDLNPFAKPQIAQRENEDDTE